MNEKVKITLPSGECVAAAAPYIISASRATDIPAFYMDWFMHRLHEGYLAWTNPFNGKTSYIALQNCRFIVFWSKNPSPLLRHIDALQAQGIRCYVQYTLNDYEEERLEKNVPPLAMRIDTFRKLSERIGAHAVIWRFDPLILTPSLGKEKLLNKIARLGEQLKGYTERLIFSFADINAFRKVRANLMRRGIEYIEWSESDMEQMASMLSTLNAQNGWGVQLATCAEPIDLSRYGIAHSRCIDGDLIVRIAFQDRRLMEHLGVQLLSPAEGKMRNAFSPNAVAPLPNGGFYIYTHRKDKGQRLLCGCIQAKDIGQYNTCPHACEYCYANSSIASAESNWQMHRLNPLAETITGK